MGAAMQEADHRENVVSKGRTTPEWGNGQPAGRPSLLQSPGPNPKGVPANPGSTNNKLAPTDWSPRPKVAAAAVTVPFSGLVLWIAGEFGLEMPQHVAGEVAVLIALVVAYLVSER